MFKLWHTLRATFLSWLSIPFFIFGFSLYWPAVFLLFIADTLKDNIPFNPLKSWKNIGGLKGRENEFSFWSGKRK